MAGLKTEAELRELLARKLSSGLADYVCGVRDDFPLVVPLGRPSKQQILAQFDRIDALHKTLRSWERSWGTSATYAMREAGGLQRIPTHISIPSLEVATELAAPRPHESWPRALARMREREALLREQFDQLDAATRSRVLRKTDGCDALEFELLLAAGAWFAAHDAHGMMPRAVPIPGIDSKWLDAARHRQIVCLLAGTDGLGLAGRPHLVEFAYLDPWYHAEGRRHYDSHVVGDTWETLYAPETVIIVENKDTYLNFPQVDMGFCVFGAGRAGVSCLCDAPWIRQARWCFYWGDLDADGFEILDAYRAHGLCCTSILMDLATLERYGRFGTNLEKDHKTRIVREAKELHHLTESERAAYETLTDPSYRGNRRLEQERIPLPEALRAIMACTRKG